MSFSKGVAFLVVLSILLNWYFSPSHKYTHELKQVNKVLNGKWMCEGSYNKSLFIQSHSEKNFQVVYFITNENYFDPNAIKLGYGYIDNTDATKIIFKQSTCTMDIQKALSLLGLRIFDYDSCYYTFVGHVDYENNLMSSFDYKTICIKK